MALAGSFVIGPDRTGRSVALVDGLVVAHAPDGVATLPCPNGEIMPGAVCAHTHMYSGLAFYGMPSPAVPPENFVQILERVWWRLDRALDAESLRAAARAYAARALLAGTTTLIDHHESPNFIEGSLSIVADACSELGIRAMLCYGATERNFGREEGRRGLAECRRIVASPLVRGLVGLHASFTVSDDTVREADDLARTRHRRPCSRGGGSGGCRRRAISRREGAARASVVARSAAAGIDSSARGSSGRRSSAIGSRARWLVRP
jgi:cytosine/adenosine deaminase-related metal-dependent hydrolase